MVEIILRVYHTLQGDNSLKSVERYVAGFNQLRGYHTLQVKFDLFVKFSYFVGSVFEYIHCYKYKNFNKFQPTDSELSLVVKSLKSLIFMSFIVNELSLTHLCLKSTSNG
jgi:hypothetical protein